MLVVAPVLMFFGGVNFVVFWTDSLVFYPFSALEVFVRPADVVLVVLRVVLPCCRSVKVSFCL